MSTPTIQRLAEISGLSEAAAGWVALSLGLLQHCNVPQDEIEMAIKYVAAAGWSLTHEPSGQHNLGVVVYEKDE